MRRVRISRWLAIAAVCSLLLSEGCAPVAEEAAEPGAKPEKQISKAKSKEVSAMALKFSPGDKTAYRVITEAERSIKWEGAVPDEPTFKGGRNYDRLEMAFTQEIQSVDDKGDAIAKITIKELKFSSIAKDSPPFEFDSIKPADPNHPLAKLIGQSYTIKIAPTGEVTEVIDTQGAETAARGGSVNPARTLRLLQSEAVKERHGTVVLPEAGKNQLHKSDSWSGTKRFSFGMMGSESYEKVYTLNEIIDQNNKRTAVIEMKAIPSSEAAKEMATEDLFKSSDNTKLYTGELKLDLTAGKVEKYSENLQAKWVTLFPTAAQEAGQEEPAILTMSDTRSYSIEKID